jgi:hypothetical protein
MNINAANFYSAGQNQKAAAAERASQVRKKLLKGAFQVEDAATPEETLLISQWMDSPQRQVRSEDTYHSMDTGRDTDFN